MQNLLTAKELKEAGSIVDLLDRLGFKPVPKHGRERMYISMLRENDNKPSLSVNDELGVWYDHGTGKGGNIIDFGLAYWKNLAFNEVVRKIQETCLLQPAEIKVLRPRKATKLPNYLVHSVKQLGTHPAVTEYLKSRGIFEVAKKCMKEIYYYVEDEKGLRKQFFAAGWQNDNSGWEVRNKYFKGCLGRKGITCIPGNDKKAAVFEGFMNYLSWRLENADAVHSVIVLNSLSLLQLGIDKAKLFSSLDIFFDRDKQGYAATKDFIKALPYATDRSIAYDGYNDYNDKIISQLNIVVVEHTKPNNLFSSVKVPFHR